MFSYDEAYNKSLNYFDGDELAAKVFVDKYALRDYDGNILEDTPDMMHRRLAKEFARIEEKYPNPMSENEIYELLKGFGFVIPQGSPMFGIGNDHQIVSLGNCYVLDEPKYDTYSSILKADEQLVNLSKRRAGIGITLNVLRPNGSATRNAARSSSGIVSWMERYSNSIREVGQNGRRGALMLSLSVHHPDIVEFSTIKNDDKRVTGANISVELSDEFLDAVKNDTDYELRFPVDYKQTGVKPLVSKFVKAKDVWKTIIHSAWLRAEPGLLFWDRIKKYNAVDCYPQFQTKSTNPCLSGDTLVAVANGRGFVTIKELADIGDDVDVYCMDKNKVTIKRMRHPRITGYDQDVYKVTIEGGHSFKATSNHKLLTTDNEYKEIKDLKVGDSLHIGERLELSIKDVFPNANSNSQDYIWFRNSNRKTLKSEHRLIYEYNNGEIPKDHVIHHIDFNAQNNKLDNLRCMSRHDHDELHGKHMRGENNPIYKIKKDPKKYKQYQEKQSALNIGLNNSTAKQITNSELFEKGLELTKSLNRRFSTDEWQVYAKENNLPTQFSKFRKNELGNICDFSYKCANKLNISNNEYLTLDTRIQNNFNKAVDNGYESFIENGSVYIYKACETCKQKFSIQFCYRERSFCSRYCSNQYINSDKKIKDKRFKSIRKIKDRVKNSYKQKQLQCYTKLKFELGREPLKKEWEIECKNQNIPCRIGKVSNFKSWTELKQEGNSFNHRIVSIEHVGKETVYNGTVDDVHNFYFGGFESIDEKTNKPKYIMLNNRQCGEIPLNGGSSCRLLVQNLFSYVQNPFTDQAYFDFDLYQTHAIKAQRLMDDIVDLEIEKMDKIIDKINSDPEPIDVKQSELDLWKTYQQDAIEGRRTGLGGTGLGDMLAGLGIKYGSDESIKIVESIEKTQKLASYRSSCTMAQERGPFPAWNWSLENDSEFLLQIKDEDENLYNDISKHGRRNVANLTFAPTGSVSLLTKTTSGCEPLFMLDPYTRRKKINYNDTEARVDFIDELGDKWQEFQVYHPKVKMWMDITGKTDLSESPWFGATANDIDWVQRVKLQAVLQKHIDHSISSTINLPNDVKEEKVAEIYETAWKYGCKGITVYRDGCRSGVLVSDSSKDKDSITKTTALKRPKTLKCDIYHTTAKGEEYFVLVGLWTDGTPYEIFCGKNGHINKKYKTGELIKRKRGHYDLIVDNESFENINEFITDEQETITRLASLSLRHGADINFTVHQLEKTKGMMNSFSKSVARILKKYIKDGTEVTGESCASCGSEKLIRQEGCVTCPSCGMSKCG